MQPSAHTVTTALAMHEYVKEQLRVQFPDIDESALADTLEGETDLKEILVAIMRSADEDEMLVTGIKARIEDLQERKKRIERRIETKEAIVLNAMEKAALKKIEADTFTVSTRATPGAVIVTDEALIPDDYWKPQPSQLDKAGIRDALKAKKDIPGATLSNGGVTLSVRRR